MARGSAWSPAAVDDIHCRRSWYSVGSASRSLAHEEGAVTIDRYTKIVLTVIAVALVAIAARPWLPESLGRRALGVESAHAQTTVPKYEVVVPRAWGKFIAFSNNNLLLEGSDQTWRVVDIEGRAPEYPKIKALIRWQ
jgi:hypothetical protein